MTRLIDADELKVQIPTIEDEYKYVHQIIDNAPTVEPTFGMFRAMLCETCQSYASNMAVVKLAKSIEERPQGEWIDYNNTFYKCPDCGYLLEKCCPQCQNKVILPKGGAEE